MRQITQIHVEKKASLQKSCRRLCRVYENYLEVAFLIQLLINASSGYVMYLTSQWIKSNKLAKRNQVEWLESLPKCIGNAFKLVVVS